MPNRQVYMARSENNWALGVDERKGRHSGSYMLHARLRASMKIYEDGASLLIVG